MHLHRDSNPGPWNNRSNALTTKLRRRPMAKHAPHTQAPEGNRRGQTSIHQDTKTMALVQYTNVKNMHLHRDSNPGPWNNRSNALTTKLRRRPMAKHAPHTQAPEGNRRGQTSIHQDTKTMALVQYTNVKNMHLHRDSNPGPWNNRSNALTTKLRRRPMAKHAPHTQAPEGNRRGQTSIHQDTKTMALVQYTNVKNMHLHRDSNPGPWNNRSNALTTKLRRRPMAKHAPHTQAPEGNRRGQTSIHQDTKTMALVQYTNVKNMHLHRDSNPGPWNNRSNALTTKLRRRPMAKHAMSQSSTICPMQCQC